MDLESKAAQLHFTTILIRSVLASAGATSTGTGFLYSVATGPDTAAIFLVTNKHVVDGADTVTLTFHRATDNTMVTPDLGRTVDYLVTNPSRVFIGHPDPNIDVCVLPITDWVYKSLATGIPPFIKFFVPGDVATSAAIDALQAIEEVTFVGYPNGLYDTHHYLPITRRGWSATRLDVDYKDTPVFLIDASVYPGSSGSPVVIVGSAYATKGGGLSLGSERLILLGVVAAAYQRQVPVIDVVALPIQIVNDLLNLGIVYKARVIDEVVDLVFANHGLKRHSD